MKRNILVLCLIAAMVPYSARAVWATPTHLDYRLSVKFGYADNILNYSDFDLERIGTPAADSLNRYAIDAADDFRVGVSAQARFRSLVGGHTFYSALQVSYNHYVQQEVRRYARIAVDLRRYFRRGCYLQLAGSYWPHYYYRNLFVSGSGYHRVYFDKIAGQLRLVFEVPWQAKMNLLYGIESKNFGQLFAERDLVLHRFGIAVEYPAARSIRVEGGYEYGAARSSGRDNASYRRDTSYDYFLLRFGGRYDFRAISWGKSQLAAGVTYKAIFFRTDKLTVEDRYRFGRQDDRWSWRVWLKQNLGHGIRVGADIGAVRNAAELPAADLEKFLEYSSTSANIFVEYSFGK